MKKLLLPVLLAIFPAFPASQLAAAAVSGPYQDYRETLGPHPLGFTIELHRLTRYTTTSTGPGEPPIGTVMTDQATFTITIHLPWESRAIPLGGFAWQQTDSAADALRITTMYGLDVAPEDSLLRLTGFTSEEALGVRFSDEHFFGRSGAAYLGESLGTLSLGELPVMFPDFDLSPFQGDSSSLVYVFQTTMPLADVPVPEPSAWVLAGGGALSLFCRTWRRRVRARLAG